MTIHNTKLILHYMVFFKHEMSVPLQGKQTVISVISLCRHIIRMLQPPHVIVIIGHCLLTAKLMQNAVSVSIISVTITFRHICVLAIVGLFAVSVLRIRIGLPFVIGITH